MFNLSDHFNICAHKDVQSPNDPQWGTPNSILTPFSTFYPKKKEKTCHLILSALPRPVLKSRACRGVFK